MNNEDLNKPTTNTTEDEAISKDRKLIDQLQGFKKYWEARWYLAQAFYDGAHFAHPKKDKDGGWVKAKGMGKNKVLREIPKAKKQIKSVRNQILKIKQRPVVYPNTEMIELDSNDGTVQQNEESNAAAQARYVDYLMNTKMKLQRHKKKLVRYAELFHVSFIQILNENGEYDFEVYDPFEVSIMPTISNINEYPALVKHITREFSELVGNDLYDQKVIAELKGTSSAKDGKFSASSYKNEYMTEKFGKAPENNVLIDELYELVRVKVDEEGNVVEDEDEFIEKYKDEVDEEGNPVEAPELKEEKRLRIKAYIGNKKVRDEITQLTSIPFSMFCWGDEAYHTSLMEDLMPINKAYDIFVSKLEHKVKKLDTGRMLVQKGEDHKTYTTNDGEIVRWKRVRPEMMQEASISNAFMQTISMLENDMREQGVALSSAAGIPAGVEAWRAIESLKELDYEGVGEQSDNLNECLTDLAEKLTEMVAYDLTAPVKVNMKDESGRMQTFNVIGQRGAEIIGEEELGKGTIVIDSRRETLVEIESDITWTREGKRNLTLDLIKSGILPAEVALESLKYGNTRDIIAKLLQEKTMGKSMIDMPDFQVLPDELKKEILTILSNGAPQGDPAIPKIGEGEEGGEEEPEPQAEPPQ